MVLIRQGQHALKFVGDAISRDMILITQVQEYSLSLGRFKGYCFEYACRKNINLVFKEIVKVAKTLNQEMGDEQRYVVIFKDQYHLDFFKDLITDNNLIEVTLTRNDVRFVKGKKSNLSW